MNSIEQIKKSFLDHVIAHYPAGSHLVSQFDIAINIDERKQAFGDITTNCALLLAPLLTMQPRTIAQRIAETFSHPLVNRVEVAGPGFINIYLHVHAWQELAKELFQADSTFSSQNLCSQLQLI